MINLSDTLDIPLSPLSTVEEEHVVPYTTTLWIPGTLVYTILHVASPSFPIGTHPFDFTWYSYHIPNFSSRNLCYTKHQSIPLAMSPFTFGMPNISASTPSYDLSS